MNIAIVGGGLSGALTATHLLNHPGSLQIHMIEPRAHLARGLAYSTDCPDHLLNVAATNMSALPLHPSHFHDWLKSNGYRHAGKDFFAPRQVYGRYVESLLTSAIAAQPGSFHSHGAQAVDIDCSHPAGVRLTLDDGNALHVDRVILAIGNPPPAPFAIPGLPAGPPRYFHSPWQPGATDAQPGDGPVLLIGSGLTAVDAVVALRAGGYRGVIHMLSRRGQMPHPHSRDRSVVDAPAVRPGMPLRAVVRAVRIAARRAPDWRTVVDALRPITNQVWLGFTLAEKRSFLRHLKVYWDVHRHRMAPQFGTLMHQALESGEVQSISGRLTGAAVEGDCLKAAIALRSGRERRLAVARVINCTGPGRDYRRIRSPIVQALLRKGLASLGPLGGGLESDPHGALLDSQGRPSPYLFTIGPPRTADLLETIAVPEIREQAQALAEHLAAHLAAGV